MLGPWINKIHRGDCVEVMGQMPEKSIDVIVTSPPYNIRNSTGGGMRNKGGGRWKNCGLLNGYDGLSDDMPHAEYVASQRRCLTAMMRVLKADGAIFYNHKPRVQGGLWQDRDEIVAGFPRRQEIIWERAGGINSNRGYFLPTYEVIYLICKPEFKLAEGANAMCDVWHIPQESGGAQQPAFPVELARRCIQSTDAQVVLDPFMGSGTTAVAAELLGRHWIGIDQSQKYCDDANERLARIGGTFDQKPGDETAQV
jgi:modification methylase